MLSFLGLGSAPADVAVDPEQEARSIEHAVSGLDHLLGDDFESARAVYEDAAFADVNHSTGGAVVHFLLAMLSFDENETAQAKVKIAEALAAREAALAQARRHDSVAEKRVLGSDVPHQLQISTLLQLQGLLGFLSASIPEAIKAAWRFKRSYDIVKSLERELQEKRLVTPEYVLPEGYPQMALVDRMTITGIMFSHGLMSLILSMIPPAVGRLLAIIGFKGRKSDALVELHAAAAQDDNPYNTMSVLALAIFYHGTQSLCEIVPRTDREGFASLYARVEALSRQYPKSATWQIQVSHIVQRREGLRAATKLVADLDTTDRPPQIRASHLWELAVNYIALLEFRKAAETVTELERLNNWNKTLYNYLIGGCYAELYFQGKEEADAALAEERLAAAPKTIGEKKLLGKTIPIEALIRRKLDKAKARSATGRLVDGMATSVILEMVHLFLGWAKQDEALLARSYDLVRRPGAVEDGIDDALLRNLMTASIQRKRGRTAEARQLLDGAETWDSGTFHGIPHAETWCLPAAFEELAVHAWEAGDYAETRRWLDRAEKFPEHELSARQGIRFSMADQALEDPQLQAAQ